HRPRRAVRRADPAGGLGWRRVRRPARDRRRWRGLHFHRRADQARPRDRPVAQAGLSGAPAARWPAPVGAASAATGVAQNQPKRAVAAEAAPTRAARSVGTVAESTTAALGRPWWLRRRVWLSAPGTRSLRVATLELVDAAAGVDDLVLAGVERMRRRGHFDLDQRVLVAVLPL